MILFGINRYRVFTAIFRYQVFLWSLFLQIVIVAFRIAGHITLSVCLLCFLFLLLFLLLPLSLDTWLLAAVSAGVVFSNGT